MTLFVVTAAEMMRRMMTDYITHFKRESLQLDNSILTPVVPTAGDISAVMTSASVP